jgi:hypothetical protein
MRAFPHPNMTNFCCPICRKNTDLPVVLIGIEGTEDGSIIQAQQFHLDCIDLLYRKDVFPHGLIYQIITGEDK